MHYWRHLIFIILFWNSSTCLGQRLYFCESYSLEGKPENFSNRWQVYETGGKINFLFNNEKPIHGKEIFFYIDKKAGNAFKEFDVRSIAISENESWKVLDYKIEEEGIYRITILDSNKAKLASEELTISLKEKIILPGYFQNVKITFCTAILEGIPQDTLNSIKLPETEPAEILVLLELDKPLETYRITIDFWALEGNKLDKFIESQFMDCNPDEFRGEFSYSISKPGNLRLMFYTDEQVFICKADLKVEDR